MKTWLWKISFWTSVANTYDLSIYFQRFFYCKSSWLMTCSLWWRHNLFISLDNWFCFKHIAISISGEIIACIADIFCSIYFIACFFYACQLRCFSYNFTFIITDSVFFLWAGTFLCFQDLYLAKNYMGASIE